MICQLWDRQLDFILFLTGLAGVLIALLAWKTAARSRVPRLWKMVALFGLFQGIGGWIEMIEVWQGESLYWQLPHGGLCGVSFILLAVGVGSALRSGRTLDPCKNRIENLFLKPWVLLYLLLTLLLLLPEERIFGTDTRTILILLRGVAVWGVVGFLCRYYNHYSRPSNQGSENRIPRHFQYAAVWGSLVILLAGWALTQYLSEIGCNYDRQEYRSQLRLIRNTLDNAIETVNGLARAQAGMPELTQYRNAPTLDPANKTLDQTSLVLPGSTCFLMNLNGDTIASSNRNTPESFIGKNSKFRGHFKSAARGVPGGETAVGIITKRLGYFASYPIRDTSNKIIGVLSNIYPINK